MSAASGFWLMTIGLFVAVPQSCATAQEMPFSANSSTVVGPNDRFQIVQSNLVAVQLFKLDRYCGYTQIYTATKDSSGYWKNIQNDLLDNKCNDLIHPHFQIFLSSILARNAFLIDTDIGFSWEFTEITGNKGQFLYYSWVGINADKAPVAKPLVAQHWEEAPLAPSALDMKGEATSRKNSGTVTFDDLLPTPPQKP